MANKTKQMRNLQTTKIRILKDIFKISILCSKIFKRVCEKKAVVELMRNADQSKRQFNNRIKSANSTTFASFVAAQKIVKHGKPSLMENIQKIHLLRYQNIYS